MISREEWQNSQFTIELLRLLEKKREEWTLGCLENAAIGHGSNAANYAGMVACAKYALAKIRERKSDESV